MATSIELTHKARCILPCPFLVIVPFEGIRRGSPVHTFCCADGKGGRIHEESELLLLNAESLGGEDNVCPMNYWKGLTEVILPDVAALQKQREESRAQFMAAMTVGDTDEVRVQKLAIAVQNNLLSPESAVQVSAQEVEPAVLKPIKPIEPVEPVKG